MSRFYQRPWWQFWGESPGVWLRLLLLTLCAAAHAFLAAPAQVDPSVSEGEFADVAGEHALFAAEDPRTIFARARAWPVHGTPFPDALLREAVETALRPEAPWDQVTAAITAFDLYQDRPWSPWCCNRLSPIMRLTFC
jgi:hypothetical protein